MISVLITGSNGLLGQKLIDLLLNDPNVELIATAKGENRYPLKNNDLRFYSMDITSGKDINAVFREVKPDYVINTAAMTNVDQCEGDHEGCWQLNVQAVKNLIDACEEHRSFLLHLSTDFIFDGENGPYTEDDKPHPVSFYGESKLAAEKLLQDSNIDWAIARTVLVYGISA